MSSVARTFGRYDLLLELSKGPFGSLWMARETGTTNDVVMLRRLSLESESDGPSAELLTSAAQWAISVRGAGILDAIATVVADGEVGVVTRHHPGEPLRSLLRLANFKRRAFVPGAALRVALDVLAGLETLAKAPSPPAQVPATTALLPDSIVVGTDGHSLVLDVGIAAAVRKSRAHVTNPDVAAYLAPEELEAGAKPDARTSVFSLGVLLWEMMSGGRRLFSGNTHEAIVERINAGGAPRLDAARPPGGGPIPKAVADLVARALERDPDRRFASLEEMRAGIVALGNSITGTPAEVSAIVTALAGNALTSRERSIQRAIDPSAAVSGGEVAAHEPEAAPAKAAAPAHKPAAPVVPASGATPPSAQAKRTLLGMAPAKPSRMPSIPDGGTTKVEFRPTPVAVANETPKPLTPPLPKVLTDEHPELTPGSAAARLSLIKPPKPAPSRPGAAAPADAKPHPTASRPAIDEEASDDRRLLDALTLEPAPSERSPAVEAPRAKHADQRDSVTPSESLTASKDSAPPPKPRVPTRASRVRAIAMAAVVAVVALVLVAVTFIRRSTRAPISDAPAAAALPATPPEPARSPAETAPLAPAATPEPVAVTPEPVAEPSAASEGAEQPSATPPVTAALNHSEKVRPTARAPVRTASPSATPHRATSKPAKRPARFTPPDI